MAKDSESSARAEGATQARPTGGPVPFSQEDLSDEDMADINSLLNQKPDITRHDIPAQDFQTLLARYGKGI